MFVSAYKVCDQQLVSKYESLVSGMQMIDYLLGIYAEKHDIDICLVTQYTLSQSF